MTKELKEIIKYRLGEALDSLEEAQILLKENKPRGTMNRIYYAMFYATLALLAIKELSASKHSGVISLFHKEFVKTNVFPKDLAKYLDIAFDLRTKGDYRDFVIIEKEKLKELLTAAKSFIDKAKEIITQETAR